jgi:uncharacterized NAD(P)/FAD-binding protein YdhS
MDELGRRPAKAHRIAVIGGGFTGAAFVIHAARLIPRSLEIDLIEPSAALGRGLAYSAIDPLHRINVPSSRMSLFADRPADATDWLFRNGTLPGDGSSTDEAGHHYVSRSDFGAYVANTLEETLTAADGRVRLRRHRTLATGLRRTDDGWSLALSSDDTIEADRVALCFGHAAASLPCPVSVEASADPRFVPNPWQANGLSTIEADAAVLLVGTGLTMADVAVSLLSRGHRGRITAVSRRGLLARPQGVFAEDTNFLEGLATPTTALELLRLVRRRARASIASGSGWHQAIDALRYNLPQIWRLMPEVECRRIARRLLPFWDVHRFRVAPAVHSVLERAIGDGRLAIEKAGIASIDVEGDTLAAALRRPGGLLERRRFQGIVLCIGPERDPTRIPLVGALLAAGSRAVGRRRAGSRCRCRQPSGLSRRDDRSEFARLRSDDPRRLWRNDRGAGHRAPCRTRRRSHGVWSRLRHRLYGAQGERSPAGRARAANEAAQPNAPDPRPRKEAWLEARAQFNAGLDLSDDRTISTGDPRQLARGLQGQSKSRSRQP